ncbi:MAG: hypothetical protein ABIK65_14785 [Candidatus Eisenbacteria bacterium]
MGDLLACRAEKEVDPRGNLERYRPETVRGALSLWSRAGEEFRKGGRPEEAEEAGVEVRRLSAFVERKAQAVADRVASLFGRFRAGEILSREDIDGADREIAGGLRYAPHSERLLGLQASVVSVRKEALARAWAKVLEARRDSRWGDSIVWAEWVLDIDPGDLRALEAVREGRFEEIAQTAVTLLERCEQGENPGGVEFRSAYRDLGAARSEMPDNRRADSLDAALKAALEGTTRLLIGLMDGALEGKRWEEGLGYSDRVLDLEPEVVRAVAGGNRARSYLEVIRRELADIKTAEKTGDMVLLRRSLAWLIAGTSDPNSYVDGAIAANQGIFEQSIKNRDWEKAEDCIEFGLSNGDDTGNMESRLLRNRYLYHLLGAAAIVLLLAAGAVVLAIRFSRKLRDRLLVRRVRKRIDNGDLERAFGVVSKATNSASKGRADLLGGLWCDLLECAGTEEILERAGARKRVTMFLDRLFGDTSNTGMKVRLAKGSIRVGWPSVWWKEGLAAFRERRDSLRVLQEMWDYPFRCFRVGRGRPSGVPGSPRTGSCSSRRWRMTWRHGSAVSSRGPATWRPRSDRASWTRTPPP